MATELSVGSELGLGEFSPGQQVLQGLASGFTGTPIENIQRSARQNQLLERLRAQSNNPNVMQGAAARMLAIDDPARADAIAKAIGTSDKKRQKGFFEDAAKALRLMKGGKFELVLDLFQGRIEGLQSVGADASDTVDLANRYQSALSSGDEEEMGEIAGELAQVVTAGQQGGFLGKPEGVTLSPGQVRFEGREEVARVDAKAVGLSPLQKKIEAEGINPLSPEGQKRARELNQGARTDPSLGPTPAKILEKANAQQLKAAGFANRTQAANTVLTTLEDTEDFNPARLDVALLEGSRLGNFAIPAEHQEYIQAKSDFITAVLRLESGAVIAETEFDRENLKFFPQPGDKPGVIKQKRKARARAFDNFVKQSKGVFDIQFGEEPELEGALPPGLPEGTSDNGDGTFTLPTGEVVAPQ